MLQLKQITKTYTTGNFTQIALDNINLSFRKNEFVAILGQSGSGKTTCLNVIGGLDQYDIGDLIINGKSTKHFSNSEWDAYRNNSVGFIFQAYNLITHLSIVDNVEMGMTLSGVSAKNKHQKALEVLDRVGLKEHIHKKPNQLSGGQMQRVAIARALANDPDIVLADEPTGALDTATSTQIMNLIKEIAYDKLVIMVTHNPELAEQYADRIVKFKDGKVESDTNPYDITNRVVDYQLKKTSMSFLTALKLSGKNISTKKWRTALTAFASSIGIIGIAMVLSLSSGFQIQIDKFQTDALSEFPIIISQAAMKMNHDRMNENSLSAEGEFSNLNSVYLYDSSKSRVSHKNIFTQEFLDYINNIDPKICNSVGYTRIVGMNLLRRTEERTEPVLMAVGFNMGGKGGEMDMHTLASNMSSMKGVGLTSYPETLKGTSESFLKKNYDIISGDYPKDETGLVLVVDNKNRIDHKILENLGFNTDGKKNIDFEKIVGLELKLITNDNFYTETEFGNFIPGNNYDDMYDSPDSISLKITGIVRLKPSVSLSILGNGIVYSDKLVKQIIENSKYSDIVMAQQESDYNVITMEKMDETMKTAFLSYLGGDATPFMVYLYPSDFQSKDAVLQYLNNYNTGKTEKATIVYTDLASSITEMTGGIIHAITLVLIAFAAISLVVSLIMIGIITYISVLERTKEIGVLRALGARKKDITRVFNAETFIIGTCSGLLGISIAYLLTIPVNIYIKDVTDLSNVAQLNPIHAFLLVVVSVTLTLIGGVIPAKIAARKDPVEALRTE